MRRTRMRPTRMTMRGPSRGGPNPSNPILPVSNPILLVSNPILPVSNPILPVSNPILPVSNPILPVSQQPNPPGQQTQSSRSGSPEDDETLRRPNLRRRRMMRKRTRRRRMMRRRMMRRRMMRRRMMRRRMRTRRMRTRRTRMRKRTRRLTLRRRSPTLVQRRALQRRRPTPAIRKQTLPRLRQTLPALSLNRVRDRLSRQIPTRTETPTPMAEAGRPDLLDPGSTDSSGSSRSSGSATAGDEEPTVVRSESNESITVEIDGATGERYDIAVNLAGPSNSDPAVSVTSVAVDPAGDRAAFETTIGRPTAEPSGRDPVPTE